MFRECSIDSEWYQSDILDLDMDFRYFSKKSQNRFLKRICSLAQNIPLFLPRSSDMAKPLLELCRVDPGDAFTYLSWSHIMSRSKIRIREKNFQRIWSTWNWTLHKFLRENMQAGISNMEDIHELIIWNDTYAFRVHMTTVLIGKTPLFGCVQRLEVHAFWQKLCENVTKSYLQFW